MKVELTAREVRLLASAPPNEAVRLAHREREAGLDKEYETLWNKFIHLEPSSRIQNGECMKYMTLKLTFEELRLLVTLASDQLFRKEFIDPKMPGYRPNGDISLGKSLVGRLRLMVDQSCPKKKTPTRGTGWRPEQASSSGPAVSARARGGTEPD